MDLPHAILTDHAGLQLARRGLSTDQVRGVLRAPQQIVAMREGRIIAQAVVQMGQPPGPYLLRVVLDVDREPPEVVTAYRTSKIEKYWSEP